jgi:hypothetical protein
MYVSPRVPCNFMVTLVKYQTTGHKAKVTHEAIGSAAAFEVWPHFSFFNDVLTDILQAAKAYEKHCAANGKPVSHAKAKEIACVYLILRQMYT